MIFKATPEQEDIIGHAGSAFIAACPGAGKTRIMVERARQLFPKLPPGRGIGFLSFTRSAVAELETRMHQEALLPALVFPSFIGTFDRFVWLFLIAPFGLPGSDTSPRLIPDMAEWNVQPFPTAQKLPLSFFSHTSGEMDQSVAKRKGYRPAEKTESQLLQYSRKAIEIRAAARERGMVGFDEARLVALERIDDKRISQRIAAALSARFTEMIVDEAQDCNPDDLKIISWLRGAGIPIKVICDPHQSIYGFRGGLTDQLSSFANGFNQQELKPLSGNFRSSANICKAITTLRPPSAQKQVDQALGKFKDVPHPVEVLSYLGGVSASIGSAFCELVREIGEEISECPVLAATASSGAAAVGAQQIKSTDDATLRLAMAVMDFHFPSRFNDVKSALENAHRVMLKIQNLLLDSSYHRYLSDHDINPSTWRPGVLQILRELCFDPTVFANAHAWHEHAKIVLTQRMTLPNGLSISQKLKWNARLETLLYIAAPGRAMAHTIHSVKGLEYPAVCVVTTNTLKGILDYLENETPAESAEDARELYVATSRAQKLLVFACPRSQAARLSSHLGKQGAEVMLTEI